MGIITLTSLARVLKVSPLMFVVKGFETSDARCCTLREAVLLTSAIGSLVAEKQFEAPEAGKTPEKTWVCSKRTLSFSAWECSKCLHVCASRTHIHTPMPRQCASPDLHREPPPHRAVTLLRARDGHRPSPNSLTPSAVACGLGASTQGER